MSLAREKFAELRRELAERFPAPRATGQFLRTGLAAIDDTTGGLPIAALTEIVCAAPSSGGHLLLGQLLSVTRAARRRVVLIDSADSFDPASFETDLLAHLVWVRCTGTSQALSAADLIARDANFGLVVLDLRRAPEADLRRIPGPQWYRLQRAVAPTDLALVVETPRTSVPSAQVRFALQTTSTYAALERERAALAVEISPTLSRQRLQSAAAAG